MARRRFSYGTAILLGWIALCATLLWTERGRRAREWLSAWLADRM